ncbi:MAG: chromophore lyase CpcT/CpeT [Spirulinaceae cyanobacterium]
MNPELSTLGRYLAGEFDNRQQALSNPAWFVHLRLWKRPVPLFTEDSITLFAEQVNMLNPDKPYRPRILRLRQDGDSPTLEVQYYMLKDINKFLGGGSNPELLKKITPSEIEFLPGCRLTVQTETTDSTNYQFSATNPTDIPCSFTYEGKTYCISLGFRATPKELEIHDKGIDPQTGKATWGALMEPFRFQKRQDFSL